LKSEDRVSTAWKQAPKAFPAEEEVATGGRLTSLEPVDVLCVEPQKQPLVVKQPQEVVYDVGPIAPEVQLLGQREEGLGVVREERELKNGLGVGEVVPLQVAVEATPGRPAERSKRL